ETFIDPPHVTTPPLGSIINQETIRHSSEVPKGSPRPSLTNQNTVHFSREAQNSPPASSTIRERKVVSPELAIQRPMSVRIIKQKQEHVKHAVHSETISPSPVLIESMLLLMPNQHHLPIASFEQSQQPRNSSVSINDFEPSRATSLLEQSSAIPIIANTPRRSVTQRMPVPVHNAAQWFNGPNMQNERTGRMEKVVASLVRRSFRPITTYAMPRVPILTSPSSRDHATFKGTDFFGKFIPIETLTQYYLGVRPESYQDFCIESHRMTTTPLSFNRQTQYPKPPR
ncbi:unnamed protein product, partial [Rotaria socialis]